MIKLILKLFLLMMLLAAATTSIAEKNSRLLVGGAREPQGSKEEPVVTIGKPSPCVDSDLQGVWSSPTLESNGFRFLKITVGRDNNASFQSSRAVADNNGIILDRAVTELYIVSTLNDKPLHFTNAALCEFKGSFGYSYDKFDQSNGTFSRGSGVTAVDTFGVLSADKTIMKVVQVMSQVYPDSPCNVEFVSCFPSSNALLFDTFFKVK